MNFLLAPVLQNKMYESLALSTNMVWSFKCEDVSQIRFRHVSESQFDEVLGNTYKVV